MKQIVNQRNRLLFLMAISLASVTTAFCTSGQDALQNESRAQTYLSRGLAEYRGGDLDAAIADFKKAADLSTFLKPFANTKEAAYADLSAAQIDKGNFDEALSACKTAIYFDPGFATAYQNCGVANMNKGDLQAAVSDFLAAIHFRYSDLPDTYLVLGETMYSMGDKDGAIAAFSKALQLKPKVLPKQASIYYHRGYTRESNGDTDGAIADFTMAVQLKPDFAQAYRFRGEARRKKGDLAGADADRVKAGLLPNLAATDLSLANNKKDTGDMGGAIKLYTSAIEENPQLAEAYNGRGFARVKKGYVAGAISDFNEAVRINPSFAEAYSNRGPAEILSTGNSAGAIADYDKAIQLKPDLAEAYLNRGFAKKSMGDIVGANADFAKYHALTGK